MKINFKLNLKNNLRYIYIAIVVLNLVLLFNLYQFTNKYLYQTIVLDKHLIESAIKNTGEDISLDKFNKIIEDINNKSLRQQINITNNPFD